MSQNSEILFQDKIAVITGGSRGLGAAFARSLAQRGAHVILIARDVAALEAVDDEVRRLGGSATLVPLDLTDYPALERFGKSVFDRWGRIDFLIANAAVLGILMPITHIALAQWEKTFSINLTGHWYLLRCVDLLLRQSPYARVVGVTSGVTRGFPPFWGGYSVSKAAFEAMIKTYAHEVAKTHIRANLLDPGRMRTAMRAQAFPGEDPETLPLPDTIAERALPLFSKDCTRTGALFDGRRGQFF